MMEQQLKVGSEVWLKLPYGDLFTQPHNKVNTVFIAGGTGITPFLSLFTHKSFLEYKNPRIYLGFRSKEYNIYEKDLDCLCNSSRFLKYSYENVNGVIEISDIYNDNGININYLISGPPEMIKTFKQFLIAKGVPDSQILTDDWE
jgi:ferredoxin-NADP reductase